MEGREREEEASLPPGYVSLAQLQERWLKKQHEKKVNEKREKEEKENGGREKMGGGFVRRVEKNDGGMGVIDEKGKGKAIVIGGFENGEVKKKNHWSRNNRQKKSAGIEGKGEQVEKEKDRIEVKVLDNGNGEETVDGELKGIKKIANLGMVEVFPRNGVKEGIADVNRVDFRGGFRRNGGERDRRNESKHREGRLGFGNKMEDERGSGKKWEERGREQGDYQKRYNRFTGRRNGLFKDNEVEPVSEKKVEDGMLEVFAEKCGLSEGERNVNREKDVIKGVVVQGEGLSDDRVAVKNKVDDEVLVAKSSENGETGGVGNGYSRYGNWKNGRYRNWRGNDRDGRSYRRFERFEDRPRRKYGESSKIWVKKEEKSGAVAA